MRNNERLLDKLRLEIQQKLAMEGDSLEVRELEEELRKLVRVFSGWRKIEEVRELEGELRKLVRVFSVSRKIVGVLENYEKDLKE